jgi:hypothetical protein
MQDYYARAALQDAVKALPAQLAELFAPEPWPKIPMLALLRVKANAAGLAARCPQAACRRAGECRAGTIGEKGPPCGALWSAEAIAALEASFVGVAFSHCLAQRRNEAIRKAMMAMEENLFQGKAAPARPHARKARPRNASKVAPSGSRPRKRAPQAGGIVRDDALPREDG